MISRFDRDDNTQIASIDISNEYDIIVNYRNGMVFKMGNWSDVDYKLDLAQNVMNDETIKGKTGYLTMIGTNQCSFRSSNEVTNSAVTTTAPTVTDQFGMPVTTETVTTAAYGNAGAVTGYADTTIPGIGYSNPVQTYTQNIFQ